MRKFFSFCIIIILFISANSVFAKESTNITISLAGDVMMDGSVGLQVKKSGYDYPWARVKDYFRASDLSIINLETSITTRGEEWPNKQFNFRSNPTNLDAMKAAGINMAVLANNHVLDYGHTGFLDTVDNLDKRGISHVGGGRNKKEALEGVALNRKGVKIGVLAFSRVIPDVGWYAGDNKPGLVGAYDGYTKDMFNRIEEMKKQVDVLILSFHWGIERSIEPRPEDIKIARAAIDAGVDIIMGHHPHVLQGIEIYKGKPIFYSLGNFVFGAADTLTKMTMIGQVIVKNGELEKVNLIPCTIVNGRPIPVEGKERNKSIEYINNLSKAFNTSVNRDGIIYIGGGTNGKSGKKTRVNMTRWRYQIDLLY